MKMSRPDFSHISMDRMKADRAELIRKPGFLLILNKTFSHLVLAISGISDLTRAIVAGYDDDGNKALSAEKVSDVEITAEIIKYLFPPPYVVVTPDPDEAYVPPPNVTVVTDMQEFLQRQHRLVFDRDKHKPEYVTESVEESARVIMSFLGRYYPLLDVSVPLNMDDHDYNIVETFTN